MRLTNVARLALPLGQLRSLSTRITDGPGRPLPISFDQRRHVERGDRPGSWMAVTFRLPTGVDDARLADAWLRVVRRHGSLSSVFADDGTGGLALRSAEVVADGWVDHDAAAGQHPRDVLREVLDRSCRPFSAPAHRLCVLTPGPGEPDRRPVAIIASDHAHVDMWSMLVLARDLLQAIETDGELPPVAAFAAHTAVLEALPPAPPGITRRWGEILAAGDGSMPVFPFDLGDVSEPRPEVVEVHDVLDARGTALFEAASARSGVRPISTALAIMTAVTQRLGGGPLRAVFPVHSRSEERWRDAVGWFITNSVIECTEPSPAACARAVRDAIALGSHPLAPIMAPYGGMPEGPGMFALSWLDGRRLPPGPDIPELSSVSASIRTTGVMIWFIINDTGLHLRCRYPDTAEARANVGGWIAALLDEFRAAAEPAAS
ncbi:hypothetical protein [Mycetocola reblochoni]|uniref:Non-ribosomal peptide synthetase modules and related proteins n=2 Tax=Mycetocola reblochoni TaxID=331618 RepID=A0A1R4J181_9MICO|nr:hypothetical protein [Mycetocola reblochoni]RLP71217.1 peptide synthetase [Mycetocola reblochoni]SJN25842.1 non-ribosomal peptide synthetase modules and related proteins [Mycetocola reblochoni REB411]